MATVAALARMGPVVVSKPGRAAPDRASHVRTQAAHGGCAQGRPGQGDGLLRGRGERRGARHRDREEAGRTRIGTVGKRRAHRRPWRFRRKKRNEGGTVIR
jgi:hypothetical protein